MNEKYKDFPPGWGHLRIPTSSRRAALAGLALYSPCRPAGVWAQRAAWLTVSLFGPKALPGRGLTWHPRLEPGVWSELLARWRRELGAFDSIAAYERLQPHRSGFMLLLMERGRPVAFLKLRQGDGAPLHTEARALSEISRSRPSAFCTPEPLLLEEASGCHYLAVAPLLPQPHRVPKSPPLSLIARETEIALTGLRRPHGTPAHWRPMHGDLTPWNLRELADRSLVLFDWEEAAWGPPGADEILYRATIAALRGRPAGSSDAGEAITFWLERVRNQPAGSSRDRRLNLSLTRRLEGMRAPSKVRTLGPSSC
jgi:hypothetical protein